MQKDTTTIGSYLIHKLHQVGIEHVYGIPGDYVINFFKLLDSGPLKTVSTSTEQGAAFAADGYARKNGIGAVCVTYCVGGLNTVNGIAGAYAEKTPVVVISGAPGVNERNSDYLLHHSIQDSRSQLRVFENITVAATQLEDPETAVFEIDRVIDSCVRLKRPVYIELPRDMVHQQCPIPPRRSMLLPKRSRSGLAEALSETFEMIERADKPVLIGGVEIRRYHLEETFLKLVERSGYPYSTTFLGKSLIDESHPQFVGVYYGKLGCENVRQHIEESDCVIMLGTVMADTNLGTAQLETAKTIYATVDELRIKHHFYKDIELAEYLEEVLAKIGDFPKTCDYGPRPARDYTPVAGAPLQVSRFFDRLNDFLFPDSNIISDVGDCLFGSINLQIPKNSRYYGPVYYTSMGYAIPAAIGIMEKARNERTIIIVGDGAFQMTGMEISSYVRHGFNPIIFVINNHGYTTQRFLKEGPFNDLVDWNYHKLPDFLGAGRGFDVHTEDQLEIALEESLKNTESYSILNLHFPPKDTSETLLRLADYLGENVGGS